MRRIILAIALLTASPSYAYRMGDKAHKMLPKEAGATLPSDAIVVKKNGPIVKDILAAKDRQNLLEKTPQGVFLHVISMDMGVQATFRGGVLVPRFRMETRWQSFARNTKEVVSNERGRFIIKVDSSMKGPKRPRFLPTESKWDRFKYRLQELFNGGKRWVKLDKIRNNPHDDIYKYRKGQFDEDAVGRHKSFWSRFKRFETTPKIFVEGNKYMFSDGHHKAEAARRMGHDGAWVEVLDR